MESGESIERRKICSKYGAEFFDTNPRLIIGIALNVRDGLLPVNGLRFRPEGNGTGWFIWAGEALSEADDFYKPLHASHVADWSPLISKYLGLPPGWRFLVTPDYEDVWFDADLLKVSPLEGL